METKNDSESFRRLRVRQLWKARPSGERGQETGISFFSERLKEHNPELLPPGQGDAYQRLRAELLRAATILKLPALKA